MATAPKVIAVQEHIDHGDYQNIRYARVELTFEGVRAFIADSPYGKGDIADSLVNGLLADLLSGKDEIGWGWAWVDILNKSHIPVLRAEGWTTEQLEEVGLVSSAVITSEPLSFTSALTMLITEVTERRAGYHIPIPGYEQPDSRDLVAASDKNVRIAVDVFGEAGLLDAFYGEEDKLNFDTFYNCREYGLMVTVGGWTFAAYEHRNSDNICIEGCPATDVQEVGPYAGEDKYDVLFSAAWKHEYDAAKALIAAARYVLANPAATRAEVKQAIETATAVAA